MAKSSDNKQNRKEICSFCGRARKKLDAFVEGPGGIFICPECIELCYNIVRQEKKRLTGTELFENIPTPRQIKEHLDLYVIGQNHAKKYLLSLIHI